MVALFSAHQCELGFYYDINQQICQEVILPRLKAFLDPIYYIDSKADTLIELGTRKYPFKSFDDPFRELVNNADLSSHLNVTVYLKRNTTSTIFFKDHPVLIINLNIKILPQVIFNPTLNEDGSIKDYHLAPLVEKGQLDAIFLTQIMYKIQLINSGAFLKNINLMDGKIKTFSAIGGFFYSYWSPYKWLIFDECHFKLSFHILFTQSGTNLMIINSYWDVSINVLSLFIVSSLDCEVYKYKEIQGNLIINNNTIEKKTAANPNAIFYTLQRWNVQFTNNRLIDVIWKYPQKVFMHEQYYYPCSFNHSVTWLYENNSFIFTSQDLSYIGFYLQFLYMPNYYQEIIFRGNIFINNTFAQSGLLYISQETTLNQRVLFENNTFKNCSNKAIEQRMIWIQAEDIVMQNNSIQGGAISSGIFLQSINAKVENIQFLNVGKLVGSSTQNSFITIQRTINVSQINSTTQFLNLGAVIDNGMGNQLQLFINNLTIVESGSLFSLEHSSKDCMFRNIQFIQNNGSFMELKPTNQLDFTNPQVISILDCQFIQNKNSLFLKNYGFGRGSILFGEQKYSYCTINNSIIDGNYAKYGGVFYVERDSLLKVYDSLIINNFAVIGGVLQSVSDGIAVMTNITFRYNSALMAGLFYLFNNQNQLLIEGGLIEKNGFQFTTFKYQDFYFSNKTQSYQNLDKILSSDFLDELFRDKEEYQQLLKKIENKQNYKIQIVKATFQTSKGLVINEQPQLLLGQSGSLINLNDLSYQNTFNITENAIQLDQSQLSLLNFKIMNIKTIIPLISLQSDSVMQTINLTYYNSDGPLLFLKSSVSGHESLKLNNLTNDFSNYPMIKFMSGSHNLSDTLIVNIRTSINKKINDIISATSTTLSVQFNKQGQSVLKCIGLQNHSDIKDSIFDGNYALTDAGAINYYCTPDSDKISNIFISNYAQYGQNYASYAYRLKIINDYNNLDLQNLVSGQDFLSDLLVGIYDQNDQLVVIENDSEASLFSEDIQLQITGQTKVRASNGIYRFRSINVVAKPDYQSQMKVQSNSIDEQKIRITMIDNQQSPQSISNLNLDVRFRECIIGEVLQNNMCVFCQKGTFSLDPSQTQCQRCLDQTTCNGGAEIILDQGDIKESYVLNVLDQQMEQYMPGQVLQFAQSVNQFIFKFSL
ncbi:UNKNOWN [Stylonychia lemnae]|uniref:Uncharacterized protein n=1 Tax=Stylonychia lemnae TaxID=5949 RepID=A0A078ASV3_STYLE|nr:UNKNOWN [Stylonychia lemnae]|eukprot:CDW85269.1 UNKNOWN [Stylonychia lemnae]